MPDIMLGSVGIKMLKMVSVLREMNLVIKTKLVKAHILGKSSTYYLGGWALEGRFAL